MNTRRSFLQSLGAAFAAVSFFPRRSASAPAAEPLTLGMASYTLRKFSLEECLRMTARLGLKRIAFKSFHLPLESSEADIRRAVQKVREAGLELYGGGVIYMNNEAEVRQAFAYCRAAGMQVMIGVPKHELLDLVEKLADENDLIVAIHNHGPGDQLYSTPASVYEKVRERSPRLGLCLDIGHTQRLGLDPSVEFEKFKERVYDIHIKDVSASAPEGTTVEIGRGVIDIPKFVRTLIRHHYRGTVSLEYEKDENDPLPGAAESIGYLRGFMAAGC